MSCEEGAEEEMVKLHFELIVDFQEKYCPKLECKGYLCLCELQYPMDRASDLTCHNMELLRSGISKNKPYVLSTKAGVTAYRAKEISEAPFEQMLALFKHWVCSSMQVQAGKIAYLDMYINKCLP